MTMDPQKVVLLEEFVDELKANPALLDLPALDFFKEFLLGLGATLPKAAKQSGEEEGVHSSEANPEQAEDRKSDEEDEEEEQQEEEEIEESDDGDKLQGEEDEADPERLPEDLEPFPELGPGEVELTDEQMDKQSEAKQAAVDALEIGELESALEKYSEVIRIGNASALMYAKRADLLLKLKRPRASINDSNAALKLNPDSGKAYKTRGRAYRKLCKWEESFMDLTTGQKIDYDDDTADIVDVVSKKFKVIKERQVKKRFKEEERDKRRKIADAKRRKAKAERIYARQKKKEEEEKKRFEEAQRKMFEGKGGMPGCMGGMPGFMGGMGGMGGPGGMDPSMFAGLFGGKGKGSMFGKGNGGAPAGDASNSAKGPVIEEMD